MKATKIITLIYAAIVLAGGIIGYMKGNSLVSLVMGSSFALLLLLCAIGMHYKKITGYFGAFGLIVVLAIFFGYRFFSTGNFMPSGMMQIISLAALVGMIAFKEITE